jgi:hypothetical protein
MPGDGDLLVRIAESLNVDATPTDTRPTVPSLNTSLAQNSQRSELWRKFVN